MFFSAALLFLSLSSLYLSPCYQSLMKILHIQMEREEGSSSIFRIKSRRGGCGCCWTWWQQNYLWDWRKQDKIQWIYKLSFFSPLIINLFYFWMLPLSFFHLGEVTCGFGLGRGGQVRTLLSARRGNLWSFGELSEAKEKF